VIELYGAEIGSCLAGFQLKDELQVIHDYPTVPQVGGYLFAEMHVNFSAGSCEEIVDGHGGFPFATVVFLHKQRCSCLHIYYITESSFG
jgi:hypothetical protein